MIDHWWFSHGKTTHVQFLSSSIFIFSWAFVWLPLAISCQMNCMFRAFSVWTELCRHERLTMLTWAGTVTFLYWFRYSIYWHFVLKTANFAEKATILQVCQRVKSLLLLFYLLSKKHFYIITPRMHNMGQKCIRIHFLR